MSPIFASAAVLGAVVLLWLFFSERHDLALVTLLLYLGLLDGYLKLKTNSSTITLVRDALLYAIALGVVVRRVLRGQPLKLPPLGGWVLLYTGVVLVQLLNPGNVSLGHALASLRPHLEFVPLFFLGYLELRSARRLRALCVLLVAVAAVNGVVGYVQFRLTPAQLAAWGPGYAARIYGTGPVSGRTFTDSAGVEHTRPFGLGSDAGDGGLVGMLALAPALALVGLGGGTRARGLALAGGAQAHTHATNSQATAHTHAHATNSQAIAHAHTHTHAHTRGILLALLAGVLLAIVTSQGRTDVLAGIVAALAFVVMASAARRLMPSMVSIAAGGLALFLVLSTLSGAAQSGLFDRYKTISPASLTSTAEASRGSSLDLLPGYMARFPFGAGLGSTGPAALIAGAGHTGLDGETEFNFLVVELGLAGLAVFLAFNLRLMGRALTRIRTVDDPQARLLLAALAAGLFGIAATYLAGPSSSASPVGPYFWLLAGVLAYWLWRAPA